jgi:tRNA A37 N6-isopentenylltransferase MiaA
MRCSREGLVEEDKRLIDQYGRTPHAFSAIGVKELYPYFDGQISLRRSEERDQGEHAGIT